ncbi:hypothetical protein HK097_004617 [Rhizophlyctis rosea]|uniref:pyridoxal kinase n=1 Tax=Rhizophlyctis rosea TaxID=64517 RepID=A0AAD5SDX8_9FUNG|nr:hypothetical protein HK097_004617 [Rhizophlyctis rosea]
MIPLPHPRRVLSIQSHVVYGYVGNKAATFPLQVLGYDVDPVNAVQFSNHTGYPGRTGELLKPNEMESLVNGLEGNGMLQEYTHVLTGYIGRASCLAVIADLVQRLKRINPNVIFVLDPVMGDNDKLYVHPDLVPVYRDTLCPLADMITPNAYEAELLTSIRATNTTTALQAIDALHALHIPTVIITSVHLSDHAHKYPNTRHLHLIASYRPLAKTDPTARGKPVLFSIAFPEKEGVFTGTGDMATALLLAYLGNEDVPVAGSHGEEVGPEDLIKIEGYLKTACEKAVAAVQSVLEETISAREAWGAVGMTGGGRQAGEGEEVKDVKTLASFWKRRELAVVQSKRHYEEPVVRYKAEDVRLHFR